MLSKLPELLDLLLALSFRLDRLNLKAFTRDDQAS
jgi:hypothetical protein